MATPKRHRVLIATDGSPPAQAALLTAVKFPWGEAAQARAVVAASDAFLSRTEAARAAFAQDIERAVENASAGLSPRWPRAEVATREEFPVEAILGEADRFRASVIALGWRGQGTFRRLLAGSVSRTVAAHAKCPVLVVRDAPRAVRRFVVAYDATANAKRAIQLMCTLEAPRGGSIMVVNVIQPVSAPASSSLLPGSTRRTIKHEVAALNEERARDGQRALNDAVARLSGCGWSAKGELRTGAPLEQLLSASANFRADVLVLGARAVSGVERVLLGSVANGALNRSKVPVLLVR